MFNISKYDVIYCDIDNTIITGWFEDFLDWTWNKFRSRKLFDFLANMQVKFKLYKENEKFLQLLSGTQAPIIFLTARSKHRATRGLLIDVMYKYVDLTQIELHELASDNPAADKWWFISDVNCDRDAALFDDNPATRYYCWQIDNVDVFDARYI